MSRNYKTVVRQPFFGAVEQESCRHIKPCVNQNGVQIKFKVGVGDSSNHYFIGGLSVGGGCFKEKTAPHLRGTVSKFGKNPVSAQDWIRTSTSLRTLRPEHSASTNFATWAFRSAKVR